MFYIMIIITYIYNDKVKCEFTQVKCDYWENLGKEHTEILCYNFFYVLVSLKFQKMSKR